MYYIFLLLNKMYYSAYIHFIPWKYR